MTTLNVSLPEAMRMYVEQQVAKGAYSTASEYIRQLIREDQERRAQQRQEAFLLEGLESGEPIAVDDDWWEKQRKNLAGRGKARRTRK